LKRRLVNERRAALKDAVKKKIETPAQRQVGWLRAFWDVLLSRGGKGRRFGAHGHLGQA
jgi:hypothetical protein